MGFLFCIKEEVMQVVMKALGEIQPYSKNAKKHDARQIKNVAESIKQYGFVQPVVFVHNNRLQKSWESKKYRVSVWTI